MAELRAQRGHERIGYIHPVASAANDWEAWLDANHTTSSGVWLRLAKKGSAIQSVSRARRWSSRSGRRPSYERNAAMKESDTSILLLRQQTTGRPGWTPITPLRPARPPS